MKKPTPPIMNKLLQDIEVYRRTEVIANLGSWEWDVETDTVIWSDGLFRIFKLDSCYGAPSFASQDSFYHPADFQRLKDAVNNAVNIGEPYEIELRAIRKDGETIYCIARGFAEKEPDKKATRLFGTLQDISTLKQMQNKLTESEAMFRTVVDRMTDALSIIDYDGVFLFANTSAAKNICNGNPENVVGSNIRQFVPSDTADKLIADYRKVIQSNIPLIREVEVLLSGKQFVFINRLLPFVFGEKQKQAILSMSLDITERKAIEQVIVNNEKRFTNVFDSSPIGIAIVDPLTQSFIRANRSFCDITGYSETELKTKTVPDITHPEDWEQEKNQISSRLKGKSKNYVTEKRYITKNGEIRYVNISGNLFTDKDNKQLAIANVVDITRQKQANNKIDHLNRVLRAIRNVNQLITKEHDRGKLIQGACDNLIETHGYHGAWILLKNESGGIDATVSSGLDSEFQFFQSRLVSGINMHCAIKCFSTTGVQVIELPVQTCGDCPLVNKYSNLAAMSVRLEYAATIYGMLSVSIPAELSHDESEQSLLQEVADDIAFALHTMATEQKAQLAMEKEKILAEMLNIAPNSITIHDADGQFLFANKKTFALHGYSKDEFMKINLHNLDVPESEMLLPERFRLIDQNGEARFDVQHFRKDGSSFPLEVYTKKIIWEEKAAVLSIATDITERKRIEEELRSKEEKYRTIFENAQDVFYEASVEGTILEISPSISFASKGQYHINDLIGKSLYSFYKNPTERDTLVKRLLEDGKVVDYEIALTNKDGTIIPCSTSSKIIINNEGKPCKIIGSMRDITERKRHEVLLRESEERFRTAMQHLPGTAWITDKNLVFTLSQGAGLGKLGLKPDQVVGMSLYEFFETSDSSHISISSHIRALSGETVLYEQTQNNLVFRTILNPLYDTVGNIKNVLGLSIDITIEKKAEIEKENLNNQINKMQKLESLGLLAGGIAHDFNNLLGGIFGYIDMALDSSKDAKVSQYLSKAATTIERACSLTGQLLTFSKGGAPIKKVECLFPFTEETALFALSGSNISLKVNVPTALWPCEIDKNQIGQVIENLVINAQQAMPIGGTIELSAQNILLGENVHPTLKAVPYVKVSIIDQGIGIQKELIGKIFDPFFTTKSKGHGLGLPTCYSIINRHSGYIDVESEPGKGTTFHIYLPATTDSVSTSAESYKINHTGTGIFIVMDDEEVMRETIGEMLKSFGYSVVLKENGQTALDYLSDSDAKHIDISGMIFDLTVPGGMGGKEIIQQIRKMYPEIAVFVSSGYAEDPVMANSTEYGFTASISKPFMRAGLAELLNKYM